MTKQEIKNKVLNDIMKDIEKNATFSDKKLWGELKVIPIIKIRQIINNLKQ